MAGLIKEIRQLLG